MHNGSFFNRLFRTFLVRRLFFNWFFGHRFGRDDSFGWDSLGGWLFLNFLRRRVIGRFLFRGFFFHFFLDDGDFLDWHFFGRFVLRRLLFFDWLFSNWGRLGHWFFLHHRGVVGFRVG